MGADAAAKSFDGLALVGMSGLDVDRGRSHVHGRRDGEEPEPAGSDDGDGGAGVGTAESHGVPGDGGRLDDGRVADVEPGWEGHEAFGGRPVLVDHASVDGDAEGSVGVRRAKVVATRPAVLAPTAAVHRLDYDGGAVRAKACDLVTEDSLEAVADVHQVGAADARGADVDDLADARWLVDVIDDHIRRPVAGAAHCLHRQTPAGPGPPCM